MNRSTEKYIPIEFIFVKYAIGPVTYDVPHEFQDHGKLCWAACTNMLLKYFDDDALQCEIISKRFYNDYESCCSDTGITFESDCNEFIKISEVITTNAEWEIDSSFHGRLNESDLVEELDKNPIEIALSYDSEYMHLVIAYGYVETNQGYLFFINDPSKRTSGTYEMDFYTLKNAFNNDGWKYTWLINTN